MWITNSSGKKDAVLTMAVIGFVVVIIKVLLAGFSITTAGKTVYSFGSIDATLVGAILTPTLGAYVTRRYMDTKFNYDKNDNGVIDPDEKEA